VSNPKELGPGPKPGHCPLQPLTIASWNIRGGLQQKASAIRDLLREKQIDILFMQEAWFLPSQAFLLKETFPGYVADVNPPGELCKEERAAIQVEIQDLRSHGTDDKERKDRIAELQMSDGRSGLLVLTRDSLHPHVSVVSKGPRAQIMQFTGSNNIIIHIHGYHTNAPEARNALWGDVLKWVTAAYKKKGLPLLIGDFNAVVDPAKDRISEFDHPSMPSPCEGLLKLLGDEGKLYDVIREAAGDAGIFTRIGHLRDRNGVCRATASRIDLILAPDSMARDGQVVWANVLRDEFPSTSDHRPICCSLAVRWLPEGCLKEPMMRDTTRPSKFDIKKELRQEFRTFLNEEPIQPLPANSTLEDRVKALEERLLYVAGKSYKSLGSRPRKQNRIVPEILPELDRYNSIRRIEDQIRWILVPGLYGANAREKRRLLKNTQMPRGTPLTTQR
jgi:exonuclease III